MSGGTRITAAGRFHDSAIRCRARHHGQGAGGWTVGTERLSRSPAADSRELFCLIPGKPSGRIRDGVPAVAVHTTQGTSAGPADPGKPAGVVARRWVSRWGLQREQLQRADTEGESATGEVLASGGVGRHLAVAYWAASRAALSKA